MSQHSLNSLCNNHSDRYCGEYKNKYGEDPPFKALTANCLTKGIRHKTVIQSVDGKNVGIY